MSKKGLGKLLAGIGIGVGIGMLFAPKKGSETREDLKKKMNELLGKVKEIDMKEVKQKVENKIEEIKEELSDLDKEKVLEIAKEKGEKIKTKLSELAEYVKEKGTPVLVSAVEEVKKSTVKVLKSTIKKLVEILQYLYYNVDNK